MPEDSPCAGKENNSCLHGPVSAFMMVSIPPVWRVYISEWFVKICGKICTAEFPRVTVRVQRGRGVITRASTSFDFLGQANCQSKRSSQYNR